MIYFDNAATSFPKPPAVRQAALEAIDIYGGNPGRSGHRLSMQTAEKIYAVRESAADFFGARPENVIFTLNCTMAINFAVLGLLARGGHVLISSLEHNSVSRPLEALRQAGKASYSVCTVSEEDPKQTVWNFRKNIRPDTCAIFCTAASNLTGTVLPLRQLGRLCREYGLLFLVDGAQGAGILPLRMDELGIDVLCAAGHKGLYGTAGTGLLLLREGILPAPVLTGGTGSTSLELVQPDFLPDRLESGTLNTVGILGLGAGLDFVRRKTPEAIYKQEAALCETVFRGLSAMPHVKLLTHSFRMGEKVPVISFNIEGMDSSRAAALLSERGFALRGGFHCAALAHRQLGTTGQGAVRFSPSCFNNPREIANFLAEIKKIKKKETISGCNNRKI